VPLIERYVASLPATGPRRTAIPDPGLTFPAKPIVDRVVKGKEPASRTVMTFYSETSGRPDADIGALTNILQSRLREALREQLGQTYSVSVGQQSYLPLRGYGTLVVSFGSAPEHVEALQAAVLREIDRLVQEGPTDAEVEAFRAQERRSRETALKQNGFWLSILQSAATLGLEPQLLLDNEARLVAVTPATVRARAAQIPWRTRYTVVSLVPEAPAAAPAAQR
jgi:zinc protease